jgi:hypothetical protein
MIDPNGDKIYYLNQPTSSGGKFLRDRTSGPNAVEFISRVLKQEGFRGPYGNYTINVEAFRTSGRTLYNVAVLESPDQDWKYFNGERSNGKIQIVYQFNINNDQSSTLISDQSVNFSGVCALIYKADCESGFDFNCNCACQLVTRSTLSHSFATRIYSITTMTLCPNQCWCGYSNIYSNNCACNCSFALTEKPHVILTWDQIVTDLDLNVIDPN